MGFKERNKFKMVYQHLGDTVKGTITCIEYRIENSVFKERKTPMCTRGNQQQTYKHFNPDDLCTPMLKPKETWLSPPWLQIKDILSTRPAQSKPSSTKLWAANGFLLVLKMVARIPQAGTSAISSCCLICLLD